MSKRKQLMNTDEESNESREKSGPAVKASAWEMIEAGRYQPRRIRGSLRGRELG